MEASQQMKRRESEEKDWADKAEHVETSVEEDKCFKPELRLVV